MSSNSFFLYFVVDGGEVVYRRKTSQNNDENEEKKMCETEREREKEKTHETKSNLFRCLKREEEKIYLKTCLSCLIAPIAQYKHRFSKWIWA